MNIDFEVKGHVYTGAGYELILVLRLKVMLTLGNVNEY